MITDSLFLFSRAYPTAAKKGMLPTCTRRLSAPQSPPTMTSRERERGVGGSELTDTEGVFYKHEVAGLNGVVRRNVSALPLSPIPDGHNLRNVNKITRSDAKRKQEKDRCETK